YYPDPFVYNTKEQAVVGKVNSISVLKDIVLMNLFSDQPKDAIDIRYEIIIRPTEEKPYYILQLYYNQTAEDNNKIKVHRDTREMYFVDYFGEEQPLEAYIEEALERARYFFDKYPDAPFKFDTEAACKNYPGR